jgi:Uma2 family endonuclease
VTYEVEEPAARWLLDEVDMPESTLHDQVIDLLKLILLAWRARDARDAMIARNLACRWDPRDARVGNDPDLVVVEPAPPHADKLVQLRTWEPGHARPRVAVEVVSESNPEKDDRDAPARYAALGARELWVFDPELVGPADTGGPFRLQVWRLAESGTTGMTRTYAGAGPARSEELDAWLVVTDGATRLRLANDAEGKDLWLTELEAAQRELAKLRAEKAAEK